MSEEIKVGDRIRFKGTLTEDPSGSHPALLFANAGDLGTITEVNHNEFWKYSAKVDWWENAFNCNREDFELVKQ